MQATVKIRSFRFPNFLKMDDDRVRGGTIPVGVLSEEAAADLWDEMKPKWLEHVAERRAAITGAGT